MGVRLDSGDLGCLSVQTARMLDDAGFPDAAIVLSNNLDELRIGQIQRRIVKEAVRCGVDGERIVRRLVYGVGTRLITSAGDSSLDGVYKLVALQSDRGWQPAIKVSEDPVKTPIPGSKRVWRIYDERGQAAADLLTLEDEEPAQSALALRHPRERTTRRELAVEQISQIEPLLVDVLDEGRLVCERVAIEQIRAVRRADVVRLNAGVRKLVEPHAYHVSVSERVWALKERLLRSLSRGRTGPES